jgi:hypothetical protein
MDFSSMEQAGLIERVTVSDYEVDQLLRVLWRDAETAKQLIDLDLDCLSPEAYEQLYHQRQSVA